MTANAMSLSSSLVATMLPADPPAARSTVTLQVVPSKRAEIISQQVIQSHVQLVLIRHCSGQRSYDNTNMMALGEADVLVSTKAVSA